MIVRSTLSHNLGLHAKHKVAEGAPKRIQIPAGAALELPDDQWKAFEDAAAGAIKSGGLLIVAAPALSEEELAAAEAAELEAAQALIAAAEAKKSAAKAPAKTDGK